MVLKQYLETGAFDMVAVLRYWYCDGRDRPSATYAGYLNSCRKQK